MKRWSIVIIGVTLGFLLSNNSYAVEKVDVYEEMDIEYEGKIVINTTSVDSDDMDLLLNASPLKGVKIDLYYLNENGDMQNINTIEGFEDVNLVSDSNGVITIDNLPFGVYEYQVVEAPNGYKYESESTMLVVSLLDVEVYNTKYLVREIILAPNEVTEEYNDNNNNNKYEEKEEHEEQPVIEEPVIVEEEKVEQKSEEINKEVERKETLVDNKMITKVRSVPNNEEIEEIGKVYGKSSKKVVSNRVDMIKLITEVKINDVMKYAVLNDVKQIHIVHLVMDLPKKGHMMSIIYDKRKAKVKVRLENRRFNQLKYKTYAIG